MLQRWEQDADKLPDLAMLHAWLHSTHLCYSTSRQVGTLTCGCSLRCIDPQTIMRVASAPLDITAYRCCPWLLYYASSIALGRYW